MTDPLMRYEALRWPKLREICEDIGYGRVAQLAEQWMDEKHPGYLKAKESIAADKERNRCDEVIKQIQIDYGSQAEGQNEPEFAQLLACEMACRKIRSAIREGGPNDRRKPRTEG